MGMGNFLFRSLSEYSTFAVYGRVRLVQLMKNFWQAQTGNFALFLVILPEMSEQPYFGQRGGRVHEMTVNDNEGEGRVPEITILTGIFCFVFCAESEKSCSNSSFEQFQDNFFAY